MFNKKAIILLIKDNKLLVDREDNNNYIINLLSYL